MQIPLLAIGGIHWDILGRTDRVMAPFDDVPGRVIRVIGGVAGPISAKLVKLGSPVELVGYAGYDALGEALISELERLNVSTAKMVRGAAPTDVYMGIEAQNGLVAAISDAHSLEAHTDKALREVKHAIRGQAILLDGNLDGRALAELADDTDFTPEDVTLVPASPGKMDRLAPFLSKPYARFCLNAREGSLLLGRDLSSSASIAAAIVNAGAKAALVSNGAQECSYMAQGMTDPIIRTPPKTRVRRYTGAGDTLTANFLHRIHRDTPEAALEAALAATATFISKEDDHVSDPL